MLKTMRLSWIDYLDIRLLRTFPHLLVCARTSAIGLPARSCDIHRAARQPLRVQPCAPSVRARATTDPTCGGGGQEAKAKKGA